MGISLRGTERASVIDNQFYEYEGDYAIRLWRQPGGPKRHSKLIRISGNIITGGKRAGIFLEDSSQVMISENQIAPGEGAKAISVAASCSDITLRDNMVEGEILNESASK